MVNSAWKFMEVLIAPTVQQVLGNRVSIFLEDLRWWKRKTETTKLVKKIKPQLMKNTARDPVEFMFS